MDLNCGTKERQKRDIHVGSNKTKQHGAKLRRDGRAPKVTNTNYESRGDRSKPARLLPPRLPVLTLHRPPGTGEFANLWSLLPPNVYLFTGHFFPENLFRPATDPPLKGLTY